MKIAENLEVVRKKMKEACERVGRNPEDVTLISVGKTKPVSMLLEAYEAGARDFGRCENSYDRPSSDE